MIASVNGEKNVPRTVQTENLEPARFAPFGSYANLIQPVGPQIGSSPITFYRDMLPLELSSKNPSFCACRVEARVAGYVRGLGRKDDSGQIGFGNHDGMVLLEQTDLGIVDLLECPQQIER